MRHLHPIDLAGALALGILFALLIRGVGRRTYWFLRCLPWHLKRWRHALERRSERLKDRLFGSLDVVIEEKSLPFFVFVRMPEADYLGVVTFRRQTEGRARGKKLVRVRAHVVMEPGEAIPYPADRKRAAGANAGGLHSLMLAHVNSIDDVARQVAEHVTRIRHRRGGAGWLPPTERVTAND